MAEDNNPERVWDLIEKIRFCMLATNDGKDIRSRPMTAHAERGENAVYFLLDLKDHKNPEAFGNSCMAFADTGDMAFWDGPDDPDIRVLKITPKDAQYWDGAGKLVTFAKMLTAAVSNTKPDLGDHGKVSM